MDKSSACTGLHTSTKYSQQAVNQLCGHFEAYRDVPKITELREKFKSIKQVLKSYVFSDFSRFRFNKPLIKVLMSIQLRLGRVLDEMRCGMVEVSCWWENGMLFQRLFLLRKTPGPDGVPIAFSNLGTGKETDESSLLHHLSDACLVVNALEASVREELVNSFCNRELTSYEQIFEGAELAKLDKTER